MLIDLAGLAGKQSDAAQFLDQVAHAAGIDRRPSA